MFFLRKTVVTMSSFPRFASNIPLDVEWIVLGFLDPFEFYTHITTALLRDALESVPLDIAKEILKFAFKDPTNPNCILDPLPVERAYWRDHVGNEITAKVLFSRENVNVARYLSSTPTSWLKERNRFPFVELISESEDWVVEGPKTQILRFIMASTPPSELINFLKTTLVLNVVVGKGIESVMLRRLEVCWNEKKRMYENKCCLNVANTIRILKCGCVREAKAIGERFPEAEATLMEITKLHHAAVKDEKLDEILGYEKEGFDNWDDVFLFLLNERSYKRVMEDLRKSGRLELIEAARYLVSGTSFEKRFNAYYGQVVVVDYENKMRKRFNYYS
jgi:hypothetical protein